MILDLLDDVARSMAVVAGYLVAANRLGEEVLLMKLVQQGLHVGCMEERFVMCLVVNLSPEAL